jgi:8-amino-7-oxononanoate synthase
VDLASNDYLGMSANPTVIEAAAVAARRWGVGATGSRLVTGSTTLHTALESALAAFGGAEAALVFSSGYLANLAAVTALAAALQPPDTPATQPPALQPPDTPATQPPATPATQPPATPATQPPATPAGATEPPGRQPPGTVVVSDVANHASLVDACRLARARVEIVGHQDVAAVERALARRPEPAALVVTESAFSVDGSVAPVGALHRVTRAHAAMLVIDEAHALGVVGPGGRGAAWAAGIAAEPDVVRTVTLSKSLGAQGGAVLGASDVIDTLVGTGRAFIFDTGLAPPSTAASLAALRLLAAQPGLACQARANTRRLAALASDCGLAVTETGAAVVRIGLGDPELAVAAQRICASHGVLVGCFRPPSVPAGGSCLRLTARAGLTGDDFDAAGRALAAVRDHIRTASPAGRN